MTILETLILIWLCAGIVGYYLQKYTVKEIDKIFLKNNRCTRFDLLRKGMNKK